LYDEHRREEFVKAAFVGVSIDEIDVAQHKKFIIERLLRFGRPAHIHWLTARYSAAEIAEVVKLSKSIDRRTATYWSLRLNIPHNEVICLNRQLIDARFY
jgi:hypothetical protein